MSNIEADDVIGYSAKHVFTDSQNTILSTDKDFIQLIDKNIRVYSPTKKKMYDEEKVLEDYGITSRNFLLYRILDGDKSDNINGVMGAGLKSLIKYIPELTEDKDFTAMDLINFVNNSDSKIKLLENIKKSSNLLKRNYLLMQLNNVDIPNHTKMKIQGAVNGDVPQLIKYKFQTMFLKDKLQSNIKNFDSWIMEFVRLDRFRGLNG